MDAPIVADTPKGSSHRRKGRKRGKKYFGCVYLDRRSGVWNIRVRRNGVQVNEAVGPDKSLAEARLAAIHEATMKENALGVRTVARVTWEDFRTRLESWLKANHGDTTYATDVGRVKAVGEWLGSKILDDVTKGDVEAFLAFLRNDCEASVATTNRYRALLRVAFRVACESGFARANPVEGVKWGREQLHPVPYLDPAALDKIIARVEARFRPFVTVAADVGCRRSELIALAWEDVCLDRANPTLTVRRSKSEARTLPLTPRAVEVLAAMASARPPTPLSGAARVFAGLDILRRRGRLGVRARRGVGADAVTKAFKRAATAAGYPSLTLHGVRHAYASALARAGVAPGVIGTLLGDRTPAVVFRYSRHAPKDAAAEAVAMLAAARGQTPKSDGKSADAGDAKAAAASA